MAVAVDYNGARQVKAVSFMIAHWNNDGQKK